MGTLNLEKNDSVGVIGHSIGAMKQEKENSDLSSNDLVFDQVHVGTLSQFIFQVAADEAVTKDEYRQLLCEGYANSLHATYAKLELISTLGRWTTVR
jgi:hypothetical protein